MPEYYPNTIRAAMRYYEGARERVNVFHIKTPGAPTQQQLIDVVNVLNDWHLNNARHQQSNELVLSDITATDVSQQGGAQQQLVITPPRPGTLVIGTHPGHTTTTLSWRTARTGRRYRGRTYWPALAPNQTTTDDLLTGAVVQALALIGANLIGRFWTAGLNLGVASTVNNTTENVVSCIIDNVLDSQRRRLPGRGN